MPRVKSRMQGKICMVTGANSGIGKATALALAQLGATVVMVCRDRARGEEAKSEITTKSRKNAVDLLLADLSSQQSIRHLVEHFQHHSTHLHVLINNAGATFPGRRETVDGLEMTFAVNYRRLSCSHMCCSMCSKPARQHGLSMSVLLHKHQVTFSWMIV